ncbi:MAG: class I SAM-dependent rRNA methyltransferase [Planctomycetota bacterium]|nr:class I SAM-dependent rRNA methyltransferase [Planctomycetota bacterium]
MEYSGTTVQLRRTSDGHLHPWVYRRMVKRVSKGARDGDEAVVLAAAGRPLGRGFYHGSSTIAVRIYSGDAEQPLDDDYFRELLARSVALRRDVLALDRRTDAYRLVHAEADGLSGLVVDRYAGVLVVEIFSKALFLRREMIRRLLLELFPGARVLVKLNDLAGERERMSLPPDEAAEPGDCADVEIRENKVRFLVRPAGHKTGFFLDQRDNRERLAGLVKGAKVLDAFTYTGGFAIAARTAGKARRVVAVDLDEAAIEQGRRNGELNRAEVEWTHGDVFSYLRAQQHAVEPFDVVVLDPPKWALDRGNLEQAERRYLDVNRLALRVVRRGGVLLTCSCSGLISEERFVGLVRRAARLADRRLQVFHLGGAGGDHHPVDVHCPESRYLKAIFGRAL